MASLLCVREFDCPFSNSRTDLDRGVRRGLRRELVKFSASRWRVLQQVVEKRQMLESTGDGRREMETGNW
jgi:hypothetical protein